MSSVHAGGQRRNETLAELPALSDARFVCREPRYVGLLRRGLLILSGGGLAYAAFATPTLSWLPAALLAIASGLVVFAAIRQRPGPIHFASDSLGVYFPSRRRAGHATPRHWLFVPWSNISGIGVQLLLEESGRKGLVLSLRVSANERRQFFARSVWREALVGSAVDDGGSVRVAYPGVFNSSYRLAATLRGLQGRRCRPVDGEAEGWMTRGNETVTTPT